MSLRNTSARIAIIKGAGLSTWSGWNARVALHSTRVEFNEQTGGLFRMKLINQVPTSGETGWARQVEERSGMALEQRIAAALALRPSASLRSLRGSSRIQKLLSSRLLVFSSSRHRSEFSRREEEMKR
jgi:hypothetical protein